MTSIKSPLERRRQQRDETTGLILQVAIDVMREQGVAGMNLSEVARRMKMKPPSLYEYFPSKLALYDELFRVAWQRFSDHIYSLGLETVPFWDSLQVFLTGAIEWAQSNPELYQLAFQRPVPGFVPSEQSMELATKLQEKGERRVYRGFDEGLVRPDLDRERTRDMFFTVLAGLTGAQVANDPASEVSQGRFGRLVPDAVDMFRKAWT